MMMLHVWRAESVARSTANSRQPRVCVCVCVCVYACIGRGLADLSLSLSLYLSVTKRVGGGGGGGGGGGYRRIHARPISRAPRPTPTPPQLHPPTLDMRPENRSCPPVGQPVAGAGLAVNPGLLGQYRGQPTHGLQLRAGVVQKTPRGWRRRTPNPMALSTTLRACIYLRLSKDRACRVSRAIAWLVYPPIQVGCGDLGGEMGRVEP